MRVIRVDEPTGVDGLRLHDEPTPSPQRGELLLHVRVVALNYRDGAIAAGRYVRKSRAGLVPCSDAAAEVVEVGEGVEDYRPGDRVLSTFHPRWFGGAPPPTLEADSYGSGQDGWLAEYKVVPREAVVRLPDQLSDEHAATLPCAGVTAWSALRGPSPIRAGHSVLTLGSGGVSLFAMQLAKAVGAQVIATTSSVEKADILTQLGADEVIDYGRHPEWYEQVRDLTAGRGVDRVIEVGGPATIGQSLRAVAIGGEVTLIGWLSTDNPGIDYFALKHSLATTRPVVVGSRDDLVELVRLAAATELPPVIAQVFAFEETRAAFERLSRSQHVGKLLIRVS
ncbi:putative alcohol dehydrogenase [uncultured Mycobacterium sp.]|uniref:Putative alcohol dehydrogenase n=1 Tax=uncultured Mycobacterium sp. TaxID=171292 RepID=A0A1Y5PBK2_9MYCO|nr:putative alcohol dehydrogenase [uncultured Mycobacterium sp.]